MGHRRVVRGDPDDLHSASPTENRRRNSSGARQCQLAVSSETPIYGTAVAAKAATGFETTTGIPSTTLTRLTGEARDEGGLPRGLVRVVDEAGLVGTRQLAQVSELVHQAEGKLILIRDHLQPRTRGWRVVPSSRRQTPRRGADRQRPTARRVGERRPQRTTPRLGHPSARQYKNRGRINPATSAAEAIRNAVAQGTRMSQRSATTHKCCSSPTRTKP